LKRPDLLRSVFLGAEPAEHTEHTEPAVPRVSSPPRSPQSPALRATDLVCRFGGVRAVDGVSLSVVPGEIVGLIGPNGAGKTTLLDAISGFVPTEAGTITLGEVELTGAPVARRAWAGLGRSFQDARLFPASPSLRAGAGPRALGGGPFDRRRGAANSAVGDVGVEGAPGYRRVDSSASVWATIATSSSASVDRSRRIVDLAAVVAQRPKVVLLDEPRRASRSERPSTGPIAPPAANEAGCAMVIVEHDMGLLAQVADRLVALETGRVTPRPTGRGARPSMVVASYLGSSAELVARSGSRVQATDAGGLS
jgi:branched-chain amino acid transport system ATP-binding protein